MGLACLMVLPFALRRRDRGSVTRAEATQIAWNGLLQIGIAYACVFVAAQWIDSGLSALFFATFPIWVGVFAHFLLPGEPLTRRAVLAAALGLAGVGIIEAPAVARAFDARFGAIAAGGGLMLVSALASAYSNTLVKKHLGRVSPIFNIWGQTLVGSVFLLAGALLFERGTPSRWTPTSAGALIYLALFGTALTFAGLFWLIPRVPVAVIGTIPLVDTLLAMLLGAVVLGERITGPVVAGGVLILAGVFLAASREPARAAP
jgi:drug/metabolite transporter (DMT)-like permease